MGTSTLLRQLLRSLCQNTKWKYSVLWKLNHRSQMLLNWEDRYFNTGKSGGGLETDLHNQPPIDKLGIISFGCEMDSRSGKSVACPIEVAVASMTSRSYSLGEGIVGKVALRGRHCWISVGECNSNLLAECPEEWQLQFAAGIKTILLVPFVPFGVVQLGSLDMVLEDLNEVVRIKDFLGTTQHAGGTHISLAPRLEHLDPYAQFTMSPTGDHLASSVITDDLPSKVDSQLSAKKYSMPMGQVTENELLTVGSHLLSSVMAQPNVPVLLDVMDHALMDVGNYADESTWKDTYGDLLVNHGEEPCVPNPYMYIDNIIVGDMPIFPCFEDELDINTAIHHRLISNQSTISNSHMNDLELNDSDICWVNKTVGQQLEKEFDNGTNYIVDPISLDFPFDSELHRVLGLGSLKEQDDCVWNGILSKAEELSSLSSIYQAEQEVFRPLIEETDAWFMQETGIEHLAHTVIADLQNFLDDGVSDINVCPRSSSDLSGMFPDSCLTKCKTEDDDSRFLVARKEGITSSPTGSSSKSINNLSSISEAQHNKDTAHGLCKRGSKSSCSSKKRGKVGNFNKPRPRDRQLIQDRLKELRELIPNGSKCSIDALLDQTVKHMLFLQSIPGQAEKLRHSAHYKVKSEGHNFPGAQPHQTGASWAYELGSQSQVWPLVVENLEHPGQMLVEMQCSRDSLFLEIAQVLRRLGLNILKAVLESRSNQLWAHFIVEVSKGFHRMDILWPLVQLLQHNHTPAAGKF